MVRIAPAQFDFLILVGHINPVENTITCELDSGHYAPSSFKVKGLRN